MFNPDPGDTITLNAETYTFKPHPAFPEAAFGQEGRKAIVYQVGKNGSLHALKIFKNQYRVAELVTTCQNLSQLNLRGLEACTRQCLTQQELGRVYQSHPELEYAILMPWITGSTWFDVVAAKQSISLDQSKSIAKKTADVLSNLETKGYAHCDVAAPNVIVNTLSGEVGFIDVEDMYGPDLPPPNAFPKGTDGYQHRTNEANPQGQWCRAGDRFSAAVLLAEMICWYDSQIRQLSDIEHYFDMDELHDVNCDRYKHMMEVLKQLSTGLADCFSRAWSSATLEDCPTLTEWARLLEFPIVSEWVKLVAPPPAAKLTIEFEPLVLPVQKTIPITFEPFSIPLTTTNLPSIPAMFRTDGRSLIWAPSSDAEGYIVQEADDVSFINYKEFYEGPQVFCDLQSNSGSKYYRICAFNLNGKSSWGTPVYVKR